MKRGGPIQRKTRLGNKTPLKRGDSQMKRTPLAQRGKKDRGRTRTFEGQSERPAVCVAARDPKHTCDGPIERMHLIPKEDDRKRDYVVPSDLWEFGCRALHSQFDGLGVNGETVDMTEYLRPAQVEAVRAERGDGYVDTRLKGKRKQPVPRRLGGSTEEAA